MTAADLRQQDQDLRQRLAQAEARVRELEQTLGLKTQQVRRDTQRGQGWVFFSRAAYRCHRCTLHIPRGSTYYRTTHKHKPGFYRAAHSRIGKTIRVCYCQSCAMLLGHGAPVRKEFNQDA